MIYLCTMELGKVQPPHIFAPPDMAPAHRDIFDVDPLARQYGPDAPWAGQLVLGPNINLVYLPDPMAKTEMEKAAPPAIGDVMQFARILQEGVIMALIG